MFTDLEWVPNYSSAAFTCVLMAGVKETEEAVCLLQNLYRGWYLESVGDV